MCLHVVVGGGPYTFYYASSHAKEIGAGHPRPALRALTWNAAEVVPADELASKLATGRPLRVKLGLDPTASHVTLGWAVVLRKLREFQDFGHTAVLIVGDFTAQHR